MRRKFLPLLPKVSVVTLLEPEDARELDQLCQATNRSRGTVIRLLLHKLLHPANRPADSIDILEAGPEEAKKRG